jgi:hypothetical protein
MAPTRFNLRAIVDGLIGAAYIAGTVVASPFLRNWYSRWGATQTEIQMKLPGDDSVFYPKIQATRAITIRGQPKDIWPWLVQVGYRRAGWYSYDILEIITGAGEFIDGLSARRIIPELQQLEPGSLIYMHPRIPALIADKIEKFNSLVLTTRTDVKTGLTYSLLEKRPEEYINYTWVFFLKKLNEKECRLIVRSRYDYNPSFMNSLIWRVFTEPISFVMERKMLRGLKQRVESLTHLDWQAARKAIGLK